MMNTAELVLLIVLCSCPALVAGHGRLTSPVPRDVASTGLASALSDAPVPGGYSAAAFQCRGHARGSDQATLVTGQSVDLTWNFGAAHVGDCAVYLSYDDGTSWFKIANLFDCKAQNQQPVSVTIPDWLPACPTGTCIMRWEWYALHVRPNVEFYAQCIDVTITRGAAGAGVLPSNRYSIPGHLPDPTSSSSTCPYRNAFGAGCQTNNQAACADTHIEGPDVATNPALTSSSAGASSTSTSSSAGTTTTSSGGTTTTSTSSGSGSCSLGATALSDFCRATCDPRVVDSCTCTGGNPTATCGTAPASEEASGSAAVIPAVASICSALAIVHFSL